MSDDQTLPNQEQTRQRDAAANNQGNGSLRAVPSSLAGAQRAPEALLESDVEIALYRDRPVLVGTVFVPKQPNLEAAAAAVNAALNTERWSEYRWTTLRPEDTSEPTPVPFRVTESTIAIEKERPSLFRALVNLRARRVVNPMFPHDSE